MAAQPVFGQKILLIEDELFVRELYQRVLTQIGYTILSASDGEEGLLLAQQIPNLILLDIMLPKIDGIGVLKKIKSDQKTQKIPVLLLTNLGQESIIKEAFEIGAQGYLMKMKVTPYEIADEVRNFINNPNFMMDFHKLKEDLD